MTLVAISASYGAGGSLVARKVAERLRVPFIDRAIPFEVAARLDVPVAEALAHDDPRMPSLLERILAGFVGQDAGSPAPPPPEVVFPEDFRRATEQVLHEQAATGTGVMLGRAATIVLRDEPRVLLVRLDGPREARVRQAMRIGDIDRETAQRGLERADQAHAVYVRHFYGVGLHDTSQYHLALDSTAIDLDACVEIIVIAARARAKVEVG
jgi:cytidylate kinase